MKRSGKGSTRITWRTDPAPWAESVKAFEERTDEAEELTDSERITHPVIPKMLFYIGSSLYELRWVGLIIAAIEAMRLVVEIIK